MQICAATVMSQWMSREQWDAHEVTHDLSMFAHLLGE